MKNAFMFAAYSEILQGMDTNFRHIFKSIFSGRFIFNHNKKKKVLGRSGGMLPKKLFENLHTIVAILVLLENFSGKVC